MVSEITFIGICIITEDVSRLTEFYKKVLQATAEGDDTHAVINNTSKIIVWTTGIDNINPLRQILSKDSIVAVFNLPLFVFMFSIAVIK
jgi:hypothetical protein